MRIGEHSTETKKYLDPDGVLLSMFPTSRECGVCHTIIHLDTISDVYHDASNEPSSYFNGLVWKCLVCEHRNILTQQQTLIEAHNKRIPSRYRQECIQGAIMFLVAFLVIVGGAALMLAIAS